MSPIRTLDELRADLKRVRARFTVRDIAREAGVGRTTVNLLLADGDAPVPTTATVRKLSAWLDGIARGDEHRSRGEPAPPPAVVDPPDDVPAAAYWQGVAEATLHVLDVAGAQLETLIDSGVLAPRPADAPAARDARADTPRRRAPPDRAD